MMKIISIILGLLMIALGSLPLLNQFGILGLNISLPISVLTYILAGAGLFVLIDGFMEGFMETSGKITMLVGFLILIGGLLMVLGSFGVLPFTVPAVGIMVYNVLFIIEGILLLVAGFNPAIY